MLKVRKRHRKMSVWIIKIRLIEKPNPAGAFQDAWGQKVLNLYQVQVPVESVTVVVV